MRPIASSRERVAEVLREHGVDDEPTTDAIAELLPDGVDVAYRADYVSLPVLTTLMAEMGNRLDATINANLAEVRREAVEALREHRSETATEFSAVRESVRALSEKVNALAEKTSADNAALAEKMSAENAALSDRINALSEKVSAENSELRVNLMDALREQSEQNAAALREQSRQNSDEIRKMLEQAANDRVQLQWRVIGAVIGGCGIIATVVGVVLAVT